MTTPSTPCPACGSAAAGRFCSQCGASLTERTCQGCGAPLSARARFCHRCGRQAGQAGAAGGVPRSERSAWIFAGTMCVLLVGAIAYKVVSEQPAPRIPAMANPGAAAAATPPEAAGPAPDISRMTPRERFDRLYNRIMQAASDGDTAEVMQFTPMALGAYAQLDSFDTDARYHAAVLQLQAGDAAGAAALADTILAEAPGHLFGYVVRGGAAQLRNDSATLARARRDFLARFPAERAAGRPEYAEHAPVIEDFNREAAAEARGTDE
jgi:Double zinc ribbon